MISLRRARGLVLRLVRHRTLAALLGLALAAPAAWVEFVRGADAWWVEGLSLIFLATGLALMWTALTGASPDWIDDGT